MTEAYLHIIIENLIVQSKVMVFFWESEKRRIKEVGCDF